MRAARSIAVLVGICWFAAGCTNLSTSKKRASDVFATIIRSFADQPEGDPAMKIYVEPRGEGSSISVDVQADVVTAVEDVADVRFIDARSEALEENDAGELVVRAGGVLLAFGPVPNDATDVVVEVDQYVDETILATHRFVMYRNGDEWIIDDASVTYETVTPDET